MMDGSRTVADWIAVDWGTSNMRAWAMAADDAELSRAASDTGMGRLNRDQFEDALLEIVSPWLSDRRTTVVACGMVGSRQGWVEAPYATTPCPALALGFAKPQITHPLLDVHVIPGVKQDCPADVMRGEETQIGGFLALNPGWDGVICLPGTHTKWVEVSAGEIVSFQTYMTGEMFATLSKETVLRHSIAAVGWDDAAFHDAAEATLSKPEKLAARLFALRAEDLLKAQSGAVARSRLSGLLIGAELAASRPYWLGQQIAIIGAGEISRLYATALARQGVPATRTDAAAMTLAGLTAAHNRLKAH